MKRIPAILAVISVVAMLFAAMPMTALAAGKGDYNGDGKLNTLDVRDMLKNELSGEHTQQQIFWGDYDVDNTITTADVRLMLTDLLDTVGTSAPDYAKPTDNDYWGENAVNVLGDSISFGVGTSNDKTTDGSSSSLYNTTGGIPERSYVSYVKKAVQAANGGKMNYGFTSAYTTAWPGVARSEEIHYWPIRSEKSDGTTAWVCDNNDDGNRLTSIGMTSTTAWSTISYRLRKAYVNEYKYFCVYYQCEPNGAYFCVADGNGGEVADIKGSKLYVATASKDGSSTTMRTEFYPLAGCKKDSNGSPEITICHDGREGQPVTITGIGYYKELPKANNADGYVTFNSFTRGGISLINLSDDVLDKATSADTFIMGLGFNDFNFNHVRVNKGEFKAKIDTLIRLCNEKGTQVIVNDYVWNNPVLSANWANSQASAHAIVKSELKRFARETGGVYVDQQAIWGDAIINAINNRQEIGANSSMTVGDNIHPNHAGHKMMAKAVVEAMGLTWTEDWT
ncbi:MAG: hypothetical protein E7553_00635 [Ruminococcaceae bacterium]|nr:hypothetical protein [Oscillospiraceae bacterium]